MIGEELEPFVRHGAREARIRVAADEVLNAIAEGRDIHIEYAFIDGALEIQRIAGRLEQDEDNRLVIKGNIEIQTSEFNGCADFKYVTFRKGAVFSGTTFGTYASFNFATFTRDAIFIDAVFHMSAYFIYSIFRKGANFTGAKFNRCASFFGVSIDRPAFFREVHFHENTTLRGLWKYILRPILYPIVRFMTIGKVKLPELADTDFSGLNTTTVMDGSTNPRLKRYIDDEQWIESWRKKPKGRWWREPLFRLWELTSHCGRSISLWVFWSVGIAFGFAGIYHHLGHESITFDAAKLLGEQPDFLSYLYYSVVTFTTLGFGDIVPLTNWARLAVGIEVAFGYVMLGGLISIFANKFARRS